MNWDIDRRYYPPNPDYGNGVYRRAIGLATTPGRVVGELEDTHHGFRVVLDHDGDRVTAISGEPVRIPTTSCGGAALALERLVGRPLTMPPGDLYAGEALSHHCTHMFDLAALAIAQARRNEDRRRYDVAIPDEDATGATWCSVMRDGSVRHRWLVRAGAIVEPAAFAGQMMLAGFIRYISQRLSGDALEAALVLQKGYFVSRARRWRIDQAAGRIIAHNEQMYDRCFAYQPESRRTARHVDSTRDFTRRPEDLLRFLP